MKNLTKKIIIFISIFIGMLLLSNYSHASSGLRLKNLNYDVTLNEDGSADVTETWKISIEDTNTLFKTFEVDSTKYKEITDVKVQEITSSGERSFRKINQYKYHVDKNCYYALMNNGKFEIAWGAHAEDTTKTYKISYKIIDAVKNYNDCSEFYWQFISTESEIPANVVKGTIKLPQAVNNIEDLKVWAHGPLNGNINKVSNNIAEFEVEKLSSNTMLEARIVTPPNIFSLNKNISNINKLQNILNQEQEWADEANLQRERNARNERNKKILEIAFIVITNIIGIIVAIVIIKKIKKYKNELIEFPKILPDQELEYFRDIPNEDATPGEAGFLYYFRKTGLNVNLSKIVSATMLDLCLKKYIEFEVIPDKKNQIRVIIKKESTEELKEDEKIVMNLLKNVAKGDNKSFTMKEFQKYVEKHSTSVLRDFEKIEKEVKNQNEANGNYDKKLISKSSSYYTQGTGYIILGLISMAIMVITVIPAIIASVYCFKLGSRYNTLTKKGVNEKSQWEGLKKYMEEFSLIKDREVPELVLWEKYLVYATAFGISDKVLKQLKVVYPQITDMDYMSSNGYAYMYLMYSNNFNNSFVSTLNSSVNASYQSTINYSSGSGAGGGFSGGGGFGGGGGRNGRKIK